ncbi:MAG TPA: HEAT repeat domain-containing protein [Bryobacteraceae bacterium]|nr:HEAT repeat domain-containing protein [Bryobacteraceae bacterium]
MQNIVRAFIVAFGCVLATAQPIPPAADEPLRRAVAEQEIRAMQEKLRQREIDVRSSRTQNDIVNMTLELQRAAMLAQIAPPAPAVAPVPPLAPMKLEIGRRSGKDDEDRLYRNGKERLERREWEEAAGYFQRAADKKSTRADAALYWKAYAQNKLGRRNEASATLAELMRTHPNSRWLDDAKALEAEVKQSSGQPVSPESEADEDLKLIALQGLIHSDPERAVPVLEKLLGKGNSPRLKDRAVFVLAQSKSPRSREVLLKLARGGGNPDLQYKAVEYLGYQSTPETRQALADIYAGSSDVQLKRAVLRGFTASRDKERLFTASKAEQNSDLRREAIRGLGALDANAELWQLYEAESGKEMKMEILRALPGRRENMERLVESAKAEKDVALRAELIRQVGYSKSERSGEALVALYAPESSPEVRKVIIGSLRNQNNAKALVDIAKTETDPKLKRSVVESLSHMKSKEASDYLLEMLNK